MNFLLLLPLAVTSTTLSLSKSELYANSGDSGNVLCSVIPSSSSYSTMWYHNGNIINLENVNVFTLPSVDSSTLYFNQISPSMAGHYDCTYGNTTFNQTQITFTLYVDQAIITFPSCLNEIHMVLNMSMTYSCIPAITNQLQTAIFWMKEINGIRHQLHNTSQIMVRTESITFHSPELSDEGTYVLGVFNPLEIKYFTFTVIVNTIPSVDFLNSTAAVGILTYINCSAHGLPLPNVSIFFNNHTYHESNMSVHYTASVKNVSLPINVFVPGMYMASCLAVNIAGNDSTSAFIDYGYVPDAPLFPNMSWANLSSDRLVIQLTNRTLLNQFEIILDISENSTHYRQYEINHTIFNIVDVERNKTYNISIYIRNKYGVSPKYTASFSPLFGVPNIVNSLSFSSNHVLHWTPPANNGENISHYIIYYMGDIEITVNSNHSSYDLENLMTPGHSYHLAISAVNKIGRSQPYNFTMMIPTTTTHNPTTRLTRSTTIFTITTTRKKENKLIMPIGIIIMLIL